MDTTRKYYFKPDAESKAKLPELFRINHDGINDLLRENGELCSSLRDIRLEDKATRKAQLELDEIAKRRNEAYLEVRSEDDAELTRLARARYACRDKDTERHSALHLEYSKLKAESKKKCKKRMKDFDSEYRDRRYAALKVVNAANKTDYSKGWKDQFKDFKEEYTERTAQKQKYHLDQYYKDRLPKARKELGFDESVGFLKFVRGYGTNLPAADSIVTGHNQAGGGDGKTKTGGKYTTVEEYRKGESGGTFLKKLSFPDPSAWDPRLPKGERKRKQIGEVEISLLGRPISGTCLFHQSLPDDHCIVGASLVTSVRSGNTYFYITLTARPKSEMGKNNFEELKAYFEDLDSVGDLSEDEVKEAQKKLGKYKGNLVKKGDNGPLSEVESKLEELRARSASLREAKKGKK